MDAWPPVINRLSNQIRGSVQRIRGTSFLHMYPATGSCGPTCRLRAAGNAMDANEGEGGGRKNKKPTVAAHATRLVTVATSDAGNYKNQDQRRSQNYAEKQPPYQD